MQTSEPQIKKEYVYRYSARGHAQRAKAVVKFELISENPLQPETIHQAFRACLKHVGNFDCEIVPTSEGNCEA
jgi:hypothetical protein